MTESRRADGQLLADLWVFRAVARCGGMSAASVELNVTPGAVSQRVLRLEARIGTKLFERQKSGLALTAAGSLMLDAINSTALTLNSALARLAEPSRSSIVVSCGPSLTTEWLMPNLAEFYAEFPGIELLVRSETAQPSAAWMAREGIDVLIHYSHQRLADLVELASLQEWTFPVCSPAYLARLAQLPRERRAVVLMHDADAWRQGEPPRAEWQEWLEQAQPAWTFLTAGERHFNQAQLAYQAAVYGQGVAMARAVSVNALLKSNKLVRAVDAQPARSASYRVVARCEHAADSPAARFTSWLSRTLVATQRDTLRSFETSALPGL